MPRSYIVGTGFSLPERVITNAELIARVETNEEWIVSHTGIRERRAAADHENTSDLGAAATRNALDRAGWSPEELDLLVCATSTPDALIPATASFIGKKLGIDPVAFDVNAACSGFVYGLAVADALARSEGCAKTALTTAEKYTRVTDYDDRATCIFFGDSAGTVLLQPERPERGFELVDLTMFNTNEGAELVTTPIGECFRQDGRKVKEYALKCFERSAREILDRNSVAVSDLRAFSAHQANMRVLELVADTIGLKPEQHWHNVSTCGNQGAAGVITTFCAKCAEEESGFRAGDLFLMTVFGSGFTTGSVLLRWIDDRA